MRHGQCRRIVREFLHQQREFAVDDLDLPRVWRIVLCREYLNPWRWMYVNRRYSVSLTNANELIVEVVEEDCPDRNERKVLGNNRLIIDQACFRCICRLRRGFEWRAYWKDVDEHEDRWYFDTIDSAREEKRRILKNERKRIFPTDVVSCLF